MPPKQVVVLRYGHRLVRDYRMTTHCCLVARAFGARGIIIVSDKDESITKAVKGVVLRWGGSFWVDFTSSWRESIAEHKRKGYLVVHLTMYGEPIQKKIEAMRSAEKILLIVGSQKVDSGVYRESDLNVSVTCQPHSEVAALAIALDWLFCGRELSKGFKGAKIRVIPRAKGKKVVKVG